MLFLWPFSDKRREHMSKPRVLFVSQEINPYIPGSTISKLTRHLPQGIQERGKEIRTFMPRYGCVNERRHQLHEVIRLSGMNLVVNDFDHPLIIKVASIQPARMQVYFIDNEEYFHRKAMLEDDDEKAFEDNDERSIFFVRGVLETVKKLGWSPDIIHCHGWMTALLPTYLRTMYNDDPIFSDTKVVYSLYNGEANGSLAANLQDKLTFDGMADEVTSAIKDATYDNLHKMAIRDSDALIIGPDAEEHSVAEHIKSQDKPFIVHESEETFIDQYSEFYDKILAESSVLAD